MIEVISPVFLENGSSRLSPVLSVMFAIRFVCDLVKYPFIILFNILVINYFIGTT